MYILYIYIYAHTTYNSILVRTYYNYCVRPRPMKRFEPRTTSIRFPAHLYYSDGKIRFFRPVQIWFSDFKNCQTPYERTHVGVGWRRAGVGDDVTMLLKSLQCMVRQRISGAFPLAADGDGRKSAWSERDKAGNSVRRAAHSFQYRARNSCRPYTSRSVSLRAALKLCAHRTRHDNIIVGLVATASRAQTSGVARPRYLQTGNRRYRWVTRPANNVMFQCIVQPKNTWSRSSPELRELRVVYPGDTRHINNNCRITYRPSIIHIIVHPLNRCSYCNTFVGLPRVSEQSSREGWVEGRL